MKPEVESKLASYSSHCREAEPYLSLSRAYFPFSGVTDAGEH